MVTFLTGDDAKGILEPLGFFAGEADPWGTMLYVPKELMRNGHCSGGRPPPGPPQLPWFVAALDAWLSDEREHVLWICRAGSAAVELGHTIRAVRSALGEHRPVDGVPALVFKAVDAEIDPITSPAEGRREASLVCSLMLLLLIAEWDGFLFALGSTDRVELWEGNIIFHSTDPNRVREGVEILERFGCSQTLS